MFHSSPVLIPGLKNTFQTVLWLEGSAQQGDIQIWWGQVANCFGVVVGLSPGTRPEGWSEIDFIQDADICIDDPTGQRPSGDDDNDDGGGQGLFSIFS